MIKAMSDSSVNEHLDQLKFYQTPEHECNYLSDQGASTVFVDPAANLDINIYSRLALIGFRRSGRYIYRPRCSCCSACIPIRLPVDEFKASRSQRRVWSKNTDLEVRILDNTFNQEHYGLYERYLHARHPDGGMDDTTPEKYQNFLSCEWMNTSFIEFRLQERLIAVAVTDVMQHGLSALYTFFDPDTAHRSPGVYAILWQLQYAKQKNLDWLYLGYWIEASQKMAYKTRYRPYEIFIDGKWQKLTDTSPSADQSMNRSVIS